MRSTKRNFVVGVDASEESDQALQWAREVAGSDDRIVVVHAWDLPSLVGIDSAATIPAVEIDQLAKQGVSELVERQRDSRIEGVARQGHPGRAILGEADAEAADPIVVGHSGSGRASVLLGSTANYVLHRTERPVVVVRGDQRPSPVRVVVGVDDDDLETEGDNASVRALRWAYGLAGVRKIEVVHSWFVPVLVAGRFSSPGADFDELDREAVGVAQRVIEAAGPAPEEMSIVAIASNGTPEFALIEASRTADLIVVGSRGRGGFAGLILGSTSLDLASHSHCPVAILR